MFFYLKAVDVISKHSEQFAVKKESQALQYLKINGIRTEVEFGMKSRDCSGLGICRVQIIKKRKFSTEGCNSSIAYLTCDLFDQLCFHFFKSTVCLKVKKKYFDRDHFIIDEAFELPLSLVRKFDLNNNLIRKGRYEMVESKSFWKVIIPLY